MVVLLTVISLIVSAHTCTHCHALFDTEERMYRVDIDLSIMGIIWLWCYRRSFIYCIYHKNLGSPLAIQKVLFHCDNQAVVDIILWQL